MKNTILKISFMGLLVTSCAPKVLILQTPVVSMTKNNTEPGVALQEGEAIDFNWCTNEKPVVENTDGSKLYGMIDQVIHKAHANTKADFFLNNRFYAHNSCIIMQANVAVVKGGSGPAPKAPAANKGQPAAKPKKR